MTPLRTEGELLGRAAVVAVLLVLLAGWLVWKSAQPDRECLRQGPPTYIKIGLVMYPIENCEEWAP
jgi:hypothetical protein